MRKVSAKLKFHIAFYICVFFICCFIGWISEVIFRTYISGYLVFPGFMYGCYLPIYGFGAMIMIVCFENWTEKEVRLYKINMMPVIVFLCSLVLLTIMEYFTSYFLDKIFNLELWKYSEHFMNLNGRISLKQSSIFGFMGTIFIYLIYPKLKQRFLNINQNKMKIAAFVIAVVMCVDFIVSAYNYLKI